MANTIPFVRFPKNVADVVLRCMDVVDLISFSFCSKTTKTHAAAIELKATKFSLMFSNCHSIIVEFPGHAVPLEVLYLGEDNNQMNTLERPASVDVSLMGMPGGRYTNQDFEIRDWIAHFSVVLNSSVIEEVQINNNHFDALAIKNVLGRLTYNTLVIMPECPVAHCQSCLKTLRPNILSFVSPDPFGGNNGFMAQNLEAFNSDSSRHMTLQDLMMCNFKHSHFNGVSLNGRVLNKLLKLWIKGSNPRMQHMRMVKIRRDDTDDMWNLATIMRGIKYKVIPAEVTRSYQKCEFRVGRIHLEEFTGGFDIRRKTDGNLATILLNNENGIHKFDIIVPIH